MAPARNPRTARRTVRLRNVADSPKASASPTSGHAGKASKRPELRVIAGSRSQRSAGLNGLWRWAKSRTSPMVHIVIAVIFLVVSMLGSLALRTQMIENSFESSTIESNIATLTQDVEDDQAKLDKLEAQLPQKAEDMKMQPATDSVTIDLQGYKPTDASSDSSSSTDTDNPADTADSTDSTNSSTTGATDTQSSTDGSTN